MELRDVEAQMVVPYSLATPYLQEDTWYLFPLETESTGLSQLENPVTSSGNKPTTFRLVA
jgi:hypothetical protein